MVDVRNYKFILLIDKTVNHKESFINSHIKECPKYQNMIIATQRMLRKLDAKYEK